MVPAVFWHGNGGGCHKAARCNCNPLWESPNVNYLLSSFYYSLIISNDQGFSSLSKSKKKSILFNPLGHSLTILFSSQLIKRPPFLNPPTIKYSTTNPLIIYRNLNKSTILIVRHILSPLNIEDLATCASLNDVCKTLILKSNLVINDTPQNINACVPWPP